MAEASDADGWTLKAAREHREALDKAERRFREERDRRYAEVDLEREKALKIKETADLAALGLAREIQTYKDEKANELRSQIERERGNYATKAEIEVLIRPALDFVAAQTAVGSHRQLTTNQIVAIAGLLLIFLSIVSGVIVAMLVR